jgi:hypothetical protein
VTQPPMQPPPGPPPPGYSPWGQPPQPPPKKPKTPLLVGILIGAVTPFFGLAFPAALPDGSGAEALAPFVWALGVMLTGIGLLFADSTRRWGLGILIGFFGMLIIGAGACVAVLIVVIAAYSGG